MREACREVLNRHIEELDFELLGYRVVPVNASIPGSMARAVMPEIEQVFVRPKFTYEDQEALDRKLFVLRNYTTHLYGHNVQGNKGDFYMTSCSSRVIVYKGQLRTDQVRPYYKDLQDVSYKSSIALVHSRFSTNTFPNWKLAQPFRFLAHNGEINNIRGNLNKMKSKEALWKSDVFTEEDMSRLLPVTDGTHSDSANLDSLVEMLVLSGRSLPHVLMMLVPEAWQNNESMEKERKAFFKYHASLMEPWDGPAALLFTDGRLIGGTLDRNGLRPCRYCVTKDNKLIMASEAGTLQTHDRDIILKGRLQPGKMFLADVEEGRIITDEEIKSQVASRQPYAHWIREHRTKLRLMPDPPDFQEPFVAETLRKRQHAFGFSTEDLTKI